MTAIRRRRHYHNDWFVIEGINAHSSRRTVVSVMRSSHCVVRRVCAWDAEDGNTNIFAAHYGEHNLFEDCAGWGIARKTYSCSQQGNYTTFRRCFGVWEGCHLVGPKMTFTLFYNSHHITAENCIAAWNARLMRESHFAPGRDGKPFTAFSTGSALLDCGGYRLGRGVDDRFGRHGGPRSSVHSPDSLLVDDSPRRVGQRRESLLLVMLGDSDVLDVAGADGNLDVQFSGVSSRAGAIHAVGYAMKVQSIEYLDGRDIRASPIVVSLDPLRSLANRFHVEDLFVVPDGPLVLPLDLPDPPMHKPG